MMVWNSETLRFFVCGAILGCFVTGSISIFICTSYIDHEEKRMQEIYKTLRLSLNDLERKNKKLILFIKDRRWKDG